ncbi:unnamed protein product [Durusdinium trenchii]|uniref:Uncharacterized protein n=1 Tax=Durusdinium trenchii TaxID=1381693 RepID=A0ABP0L989_9DINO
MARVMDSQGQTGSSIPRPSISSTSTSKATSHGSRTLQSFGVPLGKTQRKPNFGESSRRTTLAQGTFSSKPS